MRRTPKNRAGFTIAEVTVSVGILAMAVMLLAQVGVQVLRELARSADRQAALEQAVNILEGARACPWDRLDQDWADQLRLRSADQARGWKLAVQVQPSKNPPGVKRVQVTIRWTSDHQALFASGYAIRPIR
jgi:Tfp pilus assembly protein PilV